MKFGFASLFILGGISLDVAQAQVATYPCPAAGTTTLLPISPSTGSTTIRLPKVSNANGLCILLRRSAADSTRRAHVARSYADKQWERAAGLFAKENSGVALDCDAGGVHECDVTLPALQEGEEFVLESYDAASVSSENEAARFLEQATFGGSLQDIQSLVSTGNDFHSWLNDQINVKPTSSIRAFYRSRTNPKFEFPYNTGAVSVLPCEKFSRWRRYAITSRDCLKERKTGLQKHLEVKQVSGVGYVIYVDDQFRTLASSRPKFGWGDNTDIKLNYRYRIGSTQEANWRTDCIGCAVLLWDEELQKIKFLPNPEIKFSGVPSSIKKYNTVSLPEYNSADLPSIDGGEDWPVFSTWVHPNEDAILNTTSLEDSNQCDGFPNFYIPLPYDEPGSPKGAFQTVFGKTPGGIEFAFDPHLALQENTVDNPLPDGGGKLSIATQGLWRGSGTGARTPGEQVMCQNVKQDFLNEEGCKLSFLKEACAPGQYPVDMIPLDESTIVGLREMTSKDVYVVENLEIDDVLDVSSVYGAPCGDGEKISRWIKDEANLLCESSVILGDETVAMFRSLVDARGESAVPNAHLVDVQKAAFPFGLQCSDVDKTKTRFGSILASDGTCWRHVHHQEHSVVDFSGMAPDLDPTGPVDLYEAEDQTLYGVDFKTSKPGFSGTGYADYRADTGLYVEFNNVDAGTGGWCILKFRYSQGTDDSRPMSVTMNGRLVGELTIAKTYDELGEPSWYVWAEETFVTVCDAGMMTIRLTSLHENGGPNLDYMSYQSANHVGGTDISGYVTPGSNFVSVPVIDAPIIGRLGDYILDNLDWPFNTQAITDAFKTVTFNPLGGPVLVCGSPEEVGSDPLHGDYGFDIVVPENEGFREKSIWELSSQRHTSWVELALHAKDSLRQKMAWALSQIIAVGLPGSGMVFYEETEQFIAFYDIFIRNAFGSYRDILKEVSYNKIMAKWLSFYSNTSLQYNIEEKGEENYPDENYAREIMQLFSIGLYKLNMDGSQVLDENGSPVETYRIEDIVSYARAWTGFAGSGKRGGTSTSGRRGDDVLDPMSIIAAYRDLFPKSDLAEGFIGDRSAPLCSDLPSGHALRKGAVWNLLGSSPQPKLQEDWSWGAELKRSLELSPASPLFDKLCSPDLHGDCTFPSIVTLDENLSYDTMSEMSEQSVDTIRTVQLKNGLASPIFYEYKRQPCVEYSFFPDGVELVQATSQNTKPSLCGDPRLAIATPMCCSSVGQEGHFYCNYQGERMTYTTAQQMCSSHGEGICQTGLVSEDSECSSGMTSHSIRSWSSNGCAIQAKVDFSSGEVAIVHDVGQSSVEAMVDKDTLNFFQVKWSTHAPSMNDCLASQSCTVHENSCICDTDVIDHQVFLSADEVSSADELMATLYTGAVDPATFDDGIYSSLGNCNIDGVTVYTKSGGCASLDEDAIFVLEVKSKQYFLKNSISKVLVKGMSSSFRNPVQYNSLADPAVRDMQFETDETIDTLFYHPSHPPFLSFRILQRFGISNPSPGLVERVSLAYTAGVYQGIGTGKYGDLGALVAAVLLDDESREAILDRDPSHGNIREPLVKLLSFFRSMGIAFDMPLRIPSLLSTEKELGQGSFESPSVFSFFLPEFQPNSPTVKSAGLVSPESMVLQGNRILFQLDAMWNMVKFGFTDNRQCGDKQGYTFSNWRNDVGDFGFKLYAGRYTHCASTEGDVSLSPAIISYQPSVTSSVDGIIDELSTLLTAGRLGDKNRALIRSAILPYFSAGDTGRATRIAQQLLLSSPEFHTTGVPRKQENVRQAVAYDTAPEQPYKALVVFVMNGGCDSFNLLVPKGQCSNGDGYNEYQKARGSHALAKSQLISINANSPQQNCQEFGIYDKFSLLGDLYNNGEALFVANTGVLSKPMTKHDEWVKETSFQLFAHNTMLHEYATGDPYEMNAGTGVFGRMLDKLKLNGYHTSANSVVGGEGALTGDQYYSNPVNSLSLTTEIAELNKIPSIDNLVDLVKELNGVGEKDNNYLAETFSDRVAMAFAEHEANAEIATNPLFNLPIDGSSGYGGSIKDDLNMNFWAVARHMKSRAYRKVNRDVYFVTQRGYDLHASNTLSTLFGGAPRNSDENERGGKADENLGRFITWLKNEGLWDSTAILMASDFGRSLNPNSGGGTDHGWGGNYFLAGGKVNGNKILGEFPSPLSPEHPNWIGRGRFIPTTPWDAVWNGIAQWMGVDNDNDLDWILPNRQKFGSNLFSGHDLFTDSPVWTSAPSGPTPAPTNRPTHEPAIPGPTPAPVTPAPVSTTASPTSTILPLQNVGNNGSPPEVFPLGLCQGDCDNDGECQPGLQCLQRSNFESVPGCSGSESDQDTDFCFGRPSPNHLWFAGDEGVPASAFPLQACEGDCDSDDDCAGNLVCMQRGGDEEVPGCIGTYGRSRTDYCYDANPSPQTPAPTQIPPTPPPTSLTTSSPTSKPTPNPTASPSNNPTNQPIAPTTPPTSPPTTPPTPVPTSKPTTSSPTPLPSQLPTAAPTTALPTSQPTTAAPTTTAAQVLTPVASVVGKSSSITMFGCDGSTDYRAIDESTDPMSCAKSGTPYGFILSPFHKQLSNVHKIRVYSSKHYPARDPVTYVIEGRVDASSPWQLIDGGDFPWITDSTPGRNPSGYKINSTYESGDSARSFTEAVLPEHDGAYLEYKITVTTRKSSEAALKFAEIELPGDVLSEITTYEAEDHNLVDSYVETNNGVQYVVLDTVGSYVEFTNVDGGSGGNCVLNVNYSNRFSNGKPIDVTVNGNVVGSFDIRPTLSGADWNNEALEATCAPGMNTIRLTAALSGGAPVNHLTVYKPGGSPAVSDPTPNPTPGPNPPVISTPEPTRTPTEHPTPLPTEVPTAQPSPLPTTATPTLPPTPQPSTSEPTSVPTSKPTTSSPTPLPSSLPTSQPTTAAPTNTAAQVLTPVASVVGKSSSITMFGCDGSTDYRAIDESTDPMSCAKSGTPYGFILSPFHKQLSNVHKIRVYSSKHYPARDPVTYVIEGRVDASSPWQLIDGGDFPWITDSTPGRNPSGYKINSTYESGDSARSFTEAVLPEHDGAYLEYKITVTTRKSSEAALKFAEIELPGDVLSEITTYEAEDHNLVDSYVETNNGVQYVVLDTVGSYVEFTNVDGGSGGNCVLNVNYSNRFSNGKPIDVTVNGNVVGSFDIRPTLSGADWNNEALEATCAPGMNTIRLTAALSGGAPVNHLTVYK